MKQIIICISLLILNSCDGQTKEQAKTLIKKSTSVIDKKNVYYTIDFLDKKYQRDGFSISDDLSGDLYPSYSYFDMCIGSFSVNFIGKSKEEQDFWNINNKKGYFSKKGNPIEIANNSNEIKKILDSRLENYYIIACLLDKKYIGNYNKSTEEFDVKKDAIESVYLYQNSKWILIKKVKEKDISENPFSLYKKLISDYLK